jgi:hypothetical protein
VLYKTKQRGFPNFYLALSDSAYPLLPTDWGPKEPTPQRLYVVMDKGRFEFHSKVTVPSTIMEARIFRNLISLEINLKELHYLKGTCLLQRLKTVDKFIL